MIDFNKKKYFVLGRFSAICCIMIFCIFVLSSCKQKYSHELTEHQKAWIADIDGQLRTTLAESAGVDQYLTEENRNKRLDDIIQKIKNDNLNDDQIYYEIKKIISDIRIAHMDFYRSQDYTSDDNYLSYLVTGSWFSEGFYVVGINEQYSECLGSELIAINGLSMNEVLERYDTIYSNETDSYLKALFEKSSLQGFSKVELDFLGISNMNEKEIRLTMRKNGEEFEQKVSAVSLDGSMEIKYEGLYDETNRLPYGLKVYYENNREPFVYEIDETNRAVYFQYNECEDVTTKGPESGYLPFDKFMEQMINDMEKNEDLFDTFVIDLRFNEGGSEILWNEAVNKYGAYLNKFPIKVLIGKSTFSAGVDTIDRTLYSFDNVILYGEETGQAVYNYTGRKSIILDNTKCEIDIADHEDHSLVIAQRATNINQGVIPDVEVLQSFENFEKGIDDIYNKAVNN